VSGNNLFAGTGGYFFGSGGIFLSTNNGGNWTAINNGLPPNVGISAFAAGETNLFAGVLSLDYYSGIGVSFH
jgi:hypothetical protein